MVRVYVFFSLSVSHRFRMPLLNWISDIRLKRHIRNVTTAKQKQKRVQNANALTPDATLYSAVTLNLIMATIKHALNIIL